VHVEHIAIWTPDLERLRAFYESHLGATAGAKYVNPAKHFESYFLRFDQGARIEIMHRSSPSPSPSPSPAGAAPPAGTVVPPSGYAHLALSVGSRAQVDALTARLREAGYAIVDGPRVTGDGYYESVVLDPDGNRIELTE
jgi:lactoylglutathione lyase